MRSNSTNGRLGLKADLGGRAGRLIWEGGGGVMIKRIFSNTPINSRSEHIITMLEFKLICATSSSRVLNLFSLVALQQSEWLDFYFCFFVHFSVSYLLPDPSKKTKRKTAIHHRTLNPEFQEVHVKKCNMSYGCSDKYAPLSVK